MSIRHTLNLDIKRECDVFIAGGGPAGVAAAVYAARTGASVYLAESTGCFGGAAVTMLIPAFMQFSNGKDFLAAGFGREIYDRIKNTCDETHRPYCPTSIPVENIKICYDDLFAQSGASHIFFTNVIDVETEEIDGQKSIKYVVCAAKGEIFAVKAKIYIDCTGDGDMAAQAGAEFGLGDEDGEMMATTLCAIWENIDWARKKGGDADRLAEAIEDGIFTNADMHLPGMWRLSERTGGSNAGHIYDIDGTSAESMTPAMAKARKQIREYRTYYREYVPGFENTELVISAPFIGIRETRRIFGDYVLKLDDFMNRTHFDDEIGCYCYPVDIHAGKNTKEGYDKFAKEHSTLRYASGESYGIPYRTLTAKGFDNLLVAGRCISTDRFMQSSVRVMPGCYITGQAAGAAAAMAADKGTDIRGIDVTELRNNLRNSGAYLPEV